VFVASLILLAWGALAKHSLRPTRHDLQMCAASGLLLWLGGNGLVSWAEKRAESAHAALLVSSLPLWTTTLESILDRRAPTLRLLGALAIGMSGVTVLNFPVLRHGSSSDVIASAALLLAVASWGIGSIMLKRRPITLAGEVSSGYQLLFGSVFLLAAAWLSGEPRPHPTPDAWWAWGYLHLGSHRVHVVREGAAVTPVHGSRRMRTNPVIAVLLGVDLASASRPDDPGPELVLLGVAECFTNSEGGCPALTGYLVHSHRLQDPPGHTDDCDRTRRRVYWRFRKDPHDRTPRRTVQGHRSNRRRWNGEVFSPNIPNPGVKPLSNLSHWRDPDTVGTVSSRSPGGSLANAKHRHDLRRRRRRRSAVHRDGIRRWRFSRLGSDRAMSIDSAIDVTIEILEGLSRGHTKQASSIGT
jgi:drug/metabolite transporter (DMT)-like permease